MHYLPSFHNFTLHSSDETWTYINIHFLCLSVIVSTRSFRHFNIELLSLRACPSSYFLVFSFVYFFAHLAQTSFVLWRKHCYVFRCHGLLARLWEDVHSHYLAFSETCDGWNRNAVTKAGSFAYNTEVFTLLLANGSKWPWKEGIRGARGTNINSHSNSLRIFFFLKLC